MTTTQGVNRADKTHPRRPPRLERVFWSLRSFYFVTFNTYKRRPVLARPEIHKTFRNYAARAQDTTWRSDVMSSCRITRICSSRCLRPALRWLKWVAMLRNVLGKDLLRLGIQKPHWQEGFFDHLLRSSESYSEKGEYVRINPVRANLCATPEEWPYQGEILAIRF